MVFYSNMPVGGDVCEKYIGQRGRHAVRQAMDSAVFLAACRHLLSVLNATREELPLATLTATDTPALCSARR